MSDDAAKALDDGLYANDPEKQREVKQVEAWAERIAKTRKFDEEAFKQYALDRKQARGDSGFQTDSNLAGTFVEILTSFLYAKDPEVDILPARATEPPSIEALRDAAMVDIDQDPALQQRLVGAASQAQAALMAPPNPLEAVGAALGVTPPPMTPEQAVAAEREAIVQERFIALQAAFRKRQRDNKAFAETLELVVSSLWKTARLKHRAGPWVNSGLTIAVGGLKASWQERMGKDPLVAQQIADLQDNIKKAAALKQKIGDTHGTEQELAIADYQAQIDALSSKSERVIARGFAIDKVWMENLTFAPGHEIADYLDMPWIDEKIPMLVDDIVAEFALTTAQAATIKRYVQRKPVMQGTTSPLVASNIDAKDADQFEEGTGNEGVGEWGMVHETWNRDANQVLTWIEGVKCWARPPMAPQPTSRFYPWFLFIIGTTNGQRHPQSLISRSAKLFDEYNRLGDAERDHRSRVKPKMAFNKGQIVPESVKKLEGGSTTEMVGVDLVDPNAKLSEHLWAVEYPAIDMGLYDESRIFNKLERIWGIQEALTGGTSSVDTATEAQIQQSGMQARTNSRRDALESALGELAQYTAEVARANMTEEDVQAIVGPDAMWPEYTGAEDLTRMVSIDIRAGSSGKPNTTAERQAWATLLPMLQTSIQTIATLRGSTPADLADAHEKLLRMTVERSGDRIDIDSLLPAAGPGLMQPGMPGAPTGAPGAPSVEPAAPVANAGAPVEPTPTTPDVA